MTGELVRIELPEPVARRGISEPQWRTLANNLYPGANVNSVLMVWDYCVARKLDPMKKPCHIVPMLVKLKSGGSQWRDVVMPGIYEYRTTAMRTGVYLGHSPPSYGPFQDHLGVSAPEWCQITVYRWNKEAQVRGEFPSPPVYFREVAATKSDKGTGEISLNERWTKAPIQMLTKCAEAAALREAFPDELGGEHTAEEVAGGQMIDVTPAHSPRDGIEEADADEVDRYVSRVADILNADFTEDQEADAWFRIHLEIHNNAAVYTALQDQLKAGKAGRKLTAANIKALTELGTKRFQSGEAPR